MAYSDDATMAWRKRVALAHARERGGTSASIALAAINEADGTRSAYGVAVNVLAALYADGCLEAADADGWMATIVKPGSRPPG
jgi:hypothetical protein